MCKIEENASKGQDPSVNPRSFAVNHHYIWKQGLNPTLYRIFVYNSQSMNFSVNLCTPYKRAYNFLQFLFKTFSSLISHLDSNSHHWKKCKHRLKSHFIANFRLQIVKYRFFVNLSTPYNGVNRAYNFLQFIFKTSKLLAN